jgi:hypothetical protein
VLCIVTASAERRVAAADAPGPTSPPLRDRPRRLTRALECLANVLAEERLRYKANSPASGSRR